jgi:hypothetical protein
LEPPNINKRFQEKCHTRKNIQQIHYKRREYFEHYTLYTKYNRLKLEAWMVVQEKYQEEKDCDKRQQQDDNYNIDRTDGTLI